MTVDLLDSYMKWYLYFCRAKKDLEILPALICEVCIMGTGP